MPQEIAWTVTCMNTVNPNPHDHSSRHLSPQRSSQPSWWYQSPLVSSKEFPTVMIIPVAICLLKGVPNRHDHTSRHLSPQRSSQPSWSYQSPFVSSKEFPTVTIILVAICLLKWVSNRHDHTSRHLSPQRSSSHTLNIGHVCGKAADLYDTIKCEKAEIYGQWAISAWSILSILELL